MQRLWGFGMIYKIVSGEATSNLQRFNSLVTCHATVHSPSSSHLNAYDCHDESRPLGSYLYLDDYMMRLGVCLVVQ